LGKFGDQATLAENSFSLEGGFITDISKRVAPRLRHPRPIFAVMGLGLESESLVGQPARVLRSVPVFIPVKEKPIESSQGSMGFGALPRGIRELSTSMMPIVCSTVELVYCQS
jgi:hypothetical protein